MSTSMALGGVDSPGGVYAMDFYGRGICYHRSRTRLSPADEFLANDRAAGQKPRVAEIPATWGFNEFAIAGEAGRSVQAPDGSRQRDARGARRA